MSLKIAIDKTDTKLCQSKLCNLKRTNINIERNVIPVTIDIFLDFQLVLHYFVTLPLRVCFKIYDINPP